MGDVRYHYDSADDERRGAVYRVWRTWMGEAKSVVAIYENEEMARWVTRILGKAAKHEI